ncbi:hypothetical protein ACFYRG_43775 [Streptomyces mirabilis]|uniref:hypothetical protein n=1 Tax=Streptomyces TaxID=1883 RepID=UPI0033A221FE
MFAVVQHHERPPLDQIFRELLQDGPRTQVRQAQRGCGHPATAAGSRAGARSTSHAPSGKDSAESMAP